VNSTGRATDNSTLGQWKGPRTYRWNLTDRAGNAVLKDRI